jgi:hypothetical protein
MERPLRIHFSHAVYHVTARGNERKPIVRDNDDRERFIQTLTGWLKGLSRGKKMKDTSPEMESYFNELIMKKTGQERLKMGFSMFDMARRQVLASILKDNPNADPGEIRREIFLRFYGQDFPPAEQERILAQILSTPPTVTIR